MLSGAEESLVRRLHRRRGREREGLFLAEGVRVVEALLESPIVPRLALVSSSLEDTDRGSALARRLDATVPIRRIDEGLLAELAGTDTPQGVLVVADVPERSLGEVEPAGAALGLVFDGVQDPGNLGTLLRTGHAFGIAFAAVLSGTVDPWNPKAVRAAAGSGFRVPVVRPSPELLLEWCDRGGFALYGSAADGVPVDTVARPQRCVLVVGNEGAGMSPAMAGRVEMDLAVPLAPGAESLNVAVAAGILLYVLSRGADNG